jgi:metal-responsive CopG/Arc/MetJ family transcriptional regulator
MRRIVTSVSLPPDLVKKIEERRGYISRSAWIVEVLSKELVRLEKAEKDPLQGMVKRVSSL